MKILEECMPPQVNPCGPGTRSIANQTCNEVEEAKSKEPEKKSAETEKDLSDALMRQLVVLRQRK